MIKQRRTKFFIIILLVLYLGSVQRAFSETVKQLGAENNCTHPSAEWHWLMDPTLATYDMGYYKICIICGEILDYEPTEKNEIPVQEIRLSAPVSEIGITSDGVRMNYEIIPNNATHKNVNWGTSDFTIATVESDGYVKPSMRPGTVTIKCYTPRSDVRAEYVLKVYCTHPSTFWYTDLDQTTFEPIRGYEKCDICGEILYSESYEKNVIPIKEIKLTQSEYTVDLAAGGLKMGYEIIPNDATNQDIVWISDDLSIAKVTNGVVEPQKIGTVKITCEAQDGSGVSASYMLKVYCSHPDTSWYVQREATTENEGMRSEICETCDQVINTETIEKLPSTNKEESKRGDVTGDDNTNIMDVIRLLKYVSGWNVTVNESACDVTGDGTINIMDVIRLLKYVSGWNVQIQ